MRSSLILTFLAMLALAGAAAAKGPSAASITGPGIDGSLAVPGNGEGGPETPLGELVRHGGWFSAVFGANAVGPVTDGRSPTQLGPKYLVTYTMPGPDRTTDAIRQDLYRYAKPAPATYMAPGQPF